MASVNRPQSSGVVQGLPVAVQPQNLSRHPTATSHQYTPQAQAKPTVQQGAAPVYLLTPRPAVPGRAAPQSKYAELLAVIEDMGRDIRPTYAGSRMATERLKRGIVHAKALVRECLAETERSART